jgi:hypothetical protein
VLEGYIIPIHGIFENIQQISGATNIRLPSLEESLVQASRCGYRELEEELLSLKLPMSLYQDAVLLIVYIVHIWLKICHMVLYCIRNIDIV